MGKRSRMVDDWFASEDSLINILPNKLSYYMGHSLEKFCQQDESNY